MEKHAQYTISINVVTKYTVQDSRVLPASHGLEEEICAN